MNVNLLFAVPGIIFAPAISALIYSRCRKSAPLFEKVCMYCVYAVIIRLIIAYPLRSLLIGLGVKLEDGSKLYLLLAALLSLLLPAVHMIVSKYIKISFEVRGRDENT